MINVVWMNIGIAPASIISKQTENQNRHDDNNFIHEYITLNQQTMANNSEVPFILCKYLTKKKINQSPYNIFD